MRALRRDRILEDLCRTRPREKRPPRQFEICGNTGTDGSDPIVASHSGNLNCGITASVCSSFLWSAIFVLRLGSPRVVAASPPTTRIKFNFSGQECPLHTCGLRNRLCGTWRLACGIECGD